MQYFTFIYAQVLQRMFAQAVMLEIYSGEDWFEFRQTHMLSWLKFLLVFLSFSENFQHSTLNKATVAFFHLLHNSLLSYNHSTVYNLSY
jgi:hypothetical protein